MSYVRNYLGNVFITVLAVIAGLFMGIFLFSLDFRSPAFAIGVGNLTHSSNKHNLSSSATHGGIKASSETRICVFCHTPHNAIVSDPDLINAPLWNHTLSIASYDLNSLDSNLINTSDITVDGASKMCMSCHDGTVAVGSTGSIGNVTMVGSCIDAEYRMTASCSGYLGETPAHHIFSVPMNDTLLSDSLDECITNTTTMRLKYPWVGTSSAPSNDNVLLRPTKNKYNNTYGVERSVSPYSYGYNYGVQCSSCHDPHLYREVGGVNCKFLVDGCTDYTDPVCLACHTTDCP